MTHSIEQQLAALGINKISQWDVLVFLHRHNTALLSAEHLGRLLGYAPAEVATALEYLQDADLVGRSRLSQGVRLYRFSRPFGSRGPTLDRLLASANSRAGRLQLIETLNRTHKKCNPKVPNKRNAKPTLLRVEFPKRVNERAEWNKTS